MKYLLFILGNFIRLVSAYAHGMPEADKQRIIDAGYFEYFLLGAKHMLTGYDFFLA